ncbi:MAG: PqqD family protein [Bacteroidia bacterium]|nr:PqqD family protein [Bacteroidia bacterium]
MYSKKNVKVNILDIIPFRSSHVETKQEGDKVVIAFPRFKRRWMALFLPKGMSPVISIVLETHGTAVWQQINGRNSVREIIEKLSEHFQNEPDYESRVVTYIYQLQKDRLIEFGV